MQKFVVDTSSLIDLEKYYPISVFPSLWNYLFEMFDEEKLFSVDEVLKTTGFTKRMDKLQTLF